VALLDQAKAALFVSKLSLLVCVEEIQQLPFEVVRRAIWNKAAY
jgi:hypothetical protein